VPFSAASAVPQPGTSTTAPVTTPTAPVTTPDVGPILGLTPPPTDLANGIAQAARLRRAIDANSRRADVLDEKYLEAQAAVRKANRQIASTQRKIDAANAKVASLKAELAGRAALLYMGAGNTDPIGFDAASVQELGARAKYGDAAAQTDERLLDDLRHTEAELNAQHDDLESQLAVAKQRQHAALDARRKVARINADMRKLLATTSANVRLLAAKMEQDALAHAAIAEQGWLLRMAARKGPDLGIPMGNIPAPSVGALLAVAYAEKQLGKPYVYAGAGPNVFDCSGLTMMAWRQAGVSMEHGSRSQWLSFPHVPIDQLAPGDLVFFGVSGPLNHHVGIVIGPGIMIEAPHTGAFVRIASYFRPDLVPVGARPTSPPGFTPKTTP
jgi:predicted  nucleic acid-binding Zn-ribbon protein